MLKGGHIMLQIGIREPGSAITHFIAMMMAIFATSPLLVKAALNGNHTTILAMAVFMGSMVLLYGASTVYHSLVVRDKILKIFLQTRPYDDICPDCRILYAGMV